MINPGFEFRTIKFILGCLLLVGCSPGTQAPSPTPSPTPDPCTGWWCTATGIVYTGAVEPGNELEGAIITLNHQASAHQRAGNRRPLVDLTESLNSMNYSFTTRMG